ncbi:MAG: hypothetical protein R3293_28140, partial [Candidatus Promineifilaceae bacterium]|nr:hypothetical protein [Candidatus Promineifilaceae bacterium]
MNEFEQLQDEILAKALDEIPVASLPPGFIANVMANVHPRAPQVSPNGTQRPTRFRLQFLDVALAVFWSLALLTVWGITLWWTGLFSPAWMPSAPF